MFRIPCAVFFAFMLLATAAAQQAAPSQRPVVGIALEGGGALGLAHIGVLRWMEEHRIPIDRLSGTSMGS
ncbi:MAG TPA: patatin-like phospholipase family protein, partial [Terracidiphilus sp.]|nr:patatin-like phospholipase family protein [Terracidiphilus sp.]